MTNQHCSLAVFAPGLPDLHPLLLSGGFWTSPTGFAKLVNPAAPLGTNWMPAAMPPTRADVLFNETV